VTGIVHLIVMEIQIVSCMVSVNHVLFIQTVNEVKNLYRSGFD